jgi:hypothetical protein
MKKLIILSAIALSGLLYNNTANAQIRVHFGISLPRVYVRPAVVVEAPAPVVYADNVAADYAPADDYYYLPDVNAYYSVADQCYYYNDGNDWVSAAYLPGEYYNFDWRTARHFEVRAPRPYLHNDFYMNRFHGANFNWARYNAPRGGFVNQDRYAAYRDNRGYDQHFDDHARFDNRGYDQHFDNRGGYNQNFNNQNRDNFQNRDNNRPQQFNKMQGQDRFAQNNRGNGNHEIAGRRMF